MISLLFIIGLFADPPKPPVIPDQLKAAFFKAEAQALQAHAALEKASADLQSKTQVLNGAINDLNKFCTGYAVKWDDKQEPACVATIPVENKKPEPTK